jgi:predicted permease
MRFLFRWRKRRNEELNEEIQGHLELAARENMESGLAPKDAQTAARREFGSIALAEEVTRDMWGGRWFVDLLQDVRYGLRTLRKSPGFTTVAVLTLALGIGATTGVFSVVNTLLLRSLPFHDPSRLALLQNFIPPDGSAEEFHDWRKRSAYLADAAVFEEWDVTLGGAHALIRAHTAYTSWNFFSVLGVQPLLGRGFLPGEDASRRSVAVIGYGLWQDLFAGDPHALEATIQVDGKPVTIIGIAPPRFDYPGKTVLWGPGNFSPGNNGWITIARLKPDISWQHARAAFDTEAARWVAKGGVRAEFFPQPRMLSLQDGLLGPVKNASLILLIAVALMLLIACSNVANLLLARTTDRTAELSIRAALGASRFRLARQLLTECLLISVVAALTGFLVAFWTISLAAKVEPPPLGAQSYSILDGRVLAFTVLVSVFSAGLFGLLPSLYVHRFRAFGTRTSGGTRGSRLARDTFVVTQVALTIVLLSGSVSVGRAFLDLMGTDRGYAVKGIDTVSVSLDGTAHQPEKRELPYFEEVLDHLRTLPGVRAASATEFLPLDATAFVGGPFGLDGHVAERNSIVVPVFSDYFRAIGGSILYGRAFNDKEVRSGANVAVVSEEFAAGFGAPAAVVGRQLTNGDEHRKIVGVIRRTDYQIGAIEAEFQVFVPDSTPGAFCCTFVVRVDGAAQQHLARVRDAIRSVDPEVPVFGVKTMEQRLDETVARPRFYRTMVWAFTGFALLLVVVGTYGILGYAVARRTHEIGIRMALGATQGRVARFVVGEVLLMVCAGIAGGAPLAFWVKPVAAALIGRSAGGVTAPIAFGSIIVFGIAVLAAYLPVRRATKVDPMVALRYE